MLQKQDPVPREGRPVPLQRTAGVAVTSTRPHSIRTEGHLLHQGFCLGLLSEWFSLTSSESLWQAGEFHWGPHREIGHLSGWLGPKTQTFPMQGLGTQTIMVGSGAPLVSPAGAGAGGGAGAPSELRAIPRALQVSRSSSCRKCSLRPNSGPPKQEEPWVLLSPATTQVLTTPES